VNPTDDTETVDGDGASENRAALSKLDLSKVELVEEVDDEGNTTPARASDDGAEEGAVSEHVNDLSSSWSASQSGDFTEQRDSNPDGRPLSTLAQHVWTDLMVVVSSSTKVNMDSVMSPGGSTGAATANSSPPAEISPPGSALPTAHLLRFLVTLMANGPKRCYEAHKALVSSCASTDQTAHGGVKDSPSKRRRCSLTCGNMHELYQNRRWTTTHHAGGPRDSAGLRRLQRRKQEADRLAEQSTYVAGAMLACSMCNDVTFAHPRCVCNRYKPYVNEKSRKLTQFTRQSMIRRLKADEMRKAQKLKAIQQVHSKKLVVGHLTATL